MHTYPKKTTKKHTIPFAGEGLSECVIATDRKAEERSISQIIYNFNPSAYVTSSCSNL